METSTFLSILGVIATLVFGLLSIDLFKRKRNPGKLTLVKHSVIGLFNNIAKNFDEISIQYKGEAIKENVIYIKASIINEGNLDIDGKNVEKTINLKLKSDLKWIKAKVTKTSADLQCKTIIDNNQSDLKFDFGLIRKNEFFQFEALIETQKEKQNADDIFENIQITHRIANTQKIDSAILLNDEQLTKRKKKMKSNAMNTGVEVLLIILILLIQVFYFKSAPIQYKNSDNITFKVQANSDRLIELTNIATNEKKEISIEDFRVVGRYTPFIPEQTFLEKIEGYSYFIPILLLIMIILIGLDYTQLRKTYRLNDIFSKSEEK